jgi:tmRNA-binding protein
MVLQGWEVKAAREGKVQLTDGYVVIREGELFVIELPDQPFAYRFKPYQPRCSSHQKAVDEER